MRIIAAAFALLLGSDALAHAIWWTHPTMFDDDSALTRDAIVSTTVEWSDAATFGEIAGTRVVAGSAASATMPDPPAGVTRCYRVFTTAVAPDGVERSGPPSEPWCRIAAVPEPEPQMLPRPLAPTNLSGN